MSPDIIQILIAADDARRPVLPDSAPRGRFRIRYSNLAQVEPLLREIAYDAVLVWTERQTEQLVRHLRQWKSIRPKAQFFVFLEETPSTRGLVTLMHAGARDVIDRAADADLAAVLDSLEERIRFVRAHQLERLQSKQSLQYTGLVGESPEMVLVFDHMLSAAESNCPVLVLGETGTGKGLVAHAIHALSQRSGKPFVTVDCGCLAPTLIESELYGVVRGAFTGAVTDRSGLVQAAQEGTLFLDEIGELPINLQPKLLRLLEEGEVRRLGSHRAVPVDVRIISATSRELERLIAAEQFRLDLYYRLNVLSIELPPLRQRPQDIPLLARHFASRHTIQGEPVTLTESVLEALSEYSWPGNVRELKNCIEATVANAGSPVAQLHHLPRRYLPGVQPAVAVPETLNLKQMEERTIFRALEVTGGDKLRAARLLGIGKTTLYRRLKQIRSAGASSRISGPPYVM